MFIEPNRSAIRKGWIEVISGSMFSGKTEELIRRLRRAQIARQRVEIFKPAIDRRFHEHAIVSHDDTRIMSTPVDHAHNVLLMATDVDVVGIDEAQFFDAEITYVVEQLALRGTRVIVAGLDMDFSGKPFGPMPALLAGAEFITKLHAICAVCGDVANFSFRKNSDAEQILIGEKDLYEPRCRYCFANG